jgi:transcriptional regulator with XRE-family HTH domain
MTTQGPEKLRAWLDARGMKQTFFSDRIGCHNTSLTRWLKGDRVPAMAERMKIAAETGGEVKPEDWA